MSNSWVLLTWHGAKHTVSAFLKTALILLLLVPSETRFSRTTTNRVHILALFSSSAGDLAHDLFQLVNPDMSLVAIFQILENVVEFCS